jgi:hypothetical protein
MALRWAAAGLAAAFSALVCLAVSRPSWRRTRLWLVTGIMSLGLAGVAFTMLHYVESACTVRYEGQTLVGGTELTPEGARYVAGNPSLTRDELLFDAAGNRDQVWTPASIAQCDLRMRLLHVGWPVSLCLGLLIVALWMGGASWWRPVPAPSSSFDTAPAGEPLPMMYDAFLSYRHGDPDAAFARWLLGELECEGYRVAIDERDFAPQRSFLAEMERCIRQSRFTLAIVSHRYFASGNAEEEAVIAKVLDMGDRKRRLIPLILEPVPMPVWMYGLSGINFAAKDPLVDPLEKIKQTLRAAASAAGPRTSGQSTD